MKLVETSKGILYIGSKDDALDLIESSAPNTFDIIWNLAKELNFLADDEGKISRQVLLGNIRDYHTPSNLATFKQQLIDIIIALTMGRKVFIHCLGGHGRTSIALASIKMLLDGFTPEQAIEFTKEQCEGPENDSQVTFIFNLQLGE